MVLFQQIYTYIYEGFFFLRHPNLKIITKVHQRFFLKDNIGTIRKRLIKQ